MSLGARIAGMRLAAVVLAGLAVVVTATSDTDQGGVVNAVLSGVTILAYVGVGTWAWKRRPENPFGALMTAVGFVFFLSVPGASDDPVLFSLGLLFGGIFLAATVHMLLAFPSGRLADCRQRRLVLALYGLLLVTNASMVLLDADVDFGMDLPENELAVVSAPEVADVLLKASLVLAIGLAFAVLRELRTRWRGATGPQRRLLGPVLRPGVVLVWSVLANITLQLVGLPMWVQSIAITPALLCFLALPFAFLVGLGRSRWFRSGAVGLLVERLGDPREGTTVGDALAEALGDPSARLLYHLPQHDRWVDADGRAAEAPGTAPGRATTQVERGGRRIAVLEHDAAVGDEPDLLRQAAQVAVLAIDNERLEAELRARVAELQDSRANVIAFGLAERRRLERDLHDGAQQRLVALSLQLKLAQTKLGKGDAAAASELIGHAAEELGLAQEELRELARGIHPAILTDRGLDAAVDALVARSPVVVDVDGLPDERLPAPVEAAAYFVVAEGLTNVAKYAHASRARIAVARSNGHVEVRVADDGVGGADLSRGTGLQGLRDRLAALDGRLVVQSPEGGGTVLEAVIPCAS